MFILLLIVLRETNASSLTLSPIWLPSSFKAFFRGSMVFSSPINPSDFAAANLTLASLSFERASIRGFIALLSPKFPSAFAAFHWISTSSAVIRASIRGFIALLSPNFPSAYAAFHWIFLSLYLVSVLVRNSIDLSLPTLPTFPIVSIMLTRSFLPLVVLKASINGSIAFSLFMKWKASTAFSLAL